MTDEAALTASERTTLELLPWYVNGTLEGAEREQVRRELRSSLTCRLEYERLCRMQTLMQGDDAEQVAADRSFERLMARIQSDAPARAAATARLPRWTSFAQAAAVVALVGSGAWWLSQGETTAPGTFTTLTSEAPASQAPQLRLVFAASVSESERQALLAKEGLTLVAPPTAEGIYTLALPEHTDARALAERLRADPRVAFVTTPPEGAGP